ncbi:MULTISPECIES: glycosyltransferase [unclassified Marinobacter]|uniref:glycosyltransferase n=1 Tax=unclassified Marinobacter TaxID=83889 RepID=UPI0012688E49|nr:MULTISPECIES: glycosyltransferase [unclassified Marinobacter]QFS85823.1 GDP-mannose-dependent alpha-(1-2)-phosphatidylinositol mannosyltransferase [Marinobacter sp. THAF197a]QFT49617.1 GDP-mannose-dependent alpha-(1-2)-phosphatidylinositol mannosyltransferase [Marinobacter sp. THAF39]
MKVALILATPSTAWGGMEKHVADLAEALTSLGHEVHIVAHPDYRTHFPFAEFHPCPMKLSRNNPWLRWCVSRILKRVSPDIAHAHGNKAALILGRLPHQTWQTVATIHGSKSNLRPFLVLDKVIAVSRSIYEGLSHPSRHLIYNGIRKEFPDSPHGNYPLPEATNVIAAGRLEPVKGFDMLVQAWSLIHKRFPTAHLTLFGDGSEAGNLHRLIDDEGLRHSVTMAGHQTTLASALSNADLMVLSSRREGFPYVLIEALIARLPVVSTPVSGSIDLLPENALARDISAPAIADVISKALAGLDRLRESEQSAFDYAQTHLTLRGMAEATVRVYQAE